MIRSTNPSCSTIVESRFTACELRCHMSATCVCVRLHGCIQSCVADLLCNFPAIITFAQGDVLPPSGDLRVPRFADMHCRPFRFWPTSCLFVLFLTIKSPHSFRPRLLRCCLRRPRLSSLSSSCPFVHASSPSTRYFGLPTGSCCLSSTLITRLLICACSRVLHLELTWSLVVTKNNFGYKSHCD